MEFKAKFMELQSKAKLEITASNRSVEVVNAKLKSALSTRTEKDYFRFVKIKRRGNQRNLEELFEDIGNYCGNFLEYELLQSVIMSNNCHTALKNEMEEYSREIRSFKYRTSGLTSIHHGRMLFGEKPRRKGYRRLKMKHAVSSKEYNLADIDSFREDVYRADSALTECALHLYGIAEGSLEVVWEVHKEFSYPLIAFFCSDAGSEVVQQHNVCEMFIDDFAINHSVCIIM